MKALVINGNPWRNTDPRIHIYKRADIIILRPVRDLGYGQVETKNGWSISTDFEDHRSIDEWDPDWFWSRAPDLSQATEQPPEGALE